MTNPSEEASKAEFDRINTEYRKEVSDNLIKWHAHYNNEYTLWGLEVMKHIALISLAGIGGVFALMTSVDFPRAHALLPAILFATSSLFCILCMYLAMVWRGLCAVRQHVLLARVRNNDFPNSKDYEYSSRVKITSGAGEACGWIAAVTMLAGGAVLFLRLAQQ